MRVLFRSSARKAFPVLPRASGRWRAWQVLVLGLALILSSLVPSAQPSRAATGIVSATPVTIPAGIVLLGGTDLWYSDHIFGFCRLDPIAGQPGKFNRGPCNTTVGPGQASASANGLTVYVPDEIGGALVRFTYDPVARNLTNRTAIPLPNPDARPIVSARVGTAVYVGYIRSADIVRVSNPNGVAPGPVAVVGATAEGGGALSFATNGTRLWIAEAASVNVIANPGVCTTLAPCTASATASTVGGPLSLAFNPANNLLYVGDGSAVWRFNPLAAGAVTELYANAALKTPPQVAVTETVPFQNVYALGFDNAGNLLVGDDPGEGIGTIYRIAAGAPAGGTLLGEDTTATLMSPAPPAGLTAPAGAIRIGNDLWYSDHLNGFCRLDLVGGVLTPAACNTSVTSPGQPSFDPVNNWVFIPDNSAQDNGVFRLTYNPTTRSVGAAAVIATSAQIGAVTGADRHQPTAAALGRDGNLYLGFIRVPDIVRIKNPGKANQTIERLGATTDGLGPTQFAFVGNNLYMGELIAGVTRFTNIPACTPTSFCAAETTGIAVGPTALQYDGFNNLFVASGGVVRRHNLSTGVTTMYANGATIPPVPPAVTPTVALFAGISAMGFDGNFNLYILDDPTAGGAEGQGHVWRIRAKSDLAVTAVDTPDPVLAGQPLNLGFSITNNGPYPANAIVLTSTLGSGVQLVSAAAASGACTGSGPVVCSNIGPLPVGGTLTVAIATRPMFAGGITNGAVITAAQLDLVPANSVAQPATLVNPAADLAATIADTPDPVPQTRPLTYQLTLTNNGPSPATDGHVIVQLPAGATFGSATPSQGTCQGAGPITCMFGTLANGGTVRAAIVLTPTVAGSLTSSLSASANEADVNPANNQATQTTQSQPVAELLLAMADTPDPVLAGELLEYTINVANLGPSAATGIVVDGALPPDALLISAWPSRAGSESCNGVEGGITCTISSLDAGAITTLKALVKQDVAGTAAHSAAIRSRAGAQQLDLDTLNNTAAVTTTVVPAANLAVTLTDLPDPVGEGLPFTYTIGVLNNGPSPASNVLLTDVLPVSVTMTSLATTQGSCSGTSSINCALGALARGASATVTVGVLPGGLGTINNLARATADEADADPSNNTGRQTTAVKPIANLSLTMAAKPDPVLAGRPLTYTMVVRNAGPSTATLIMLSDTLPTGFTATAATASQGTCSGTSTVTCSLDKLAVGATATLTIVATVDPAAAGTISNTAIVASDEVDLNPADSTATQPAMVLLYGLLLDSASVADSAPRGTTLTYTLRLTNTANISDTFTVAVSGNAWATRAAPTLGPLDPGATTVATVAVDVPRGAANGATDTATLTLTSRGDNTKSATVVLTTTATFFKQFLPRVFRLGGAGW